MNTKKKKKKKIGHILVHIPHQELGANPVREKKGGSFTNNPGKVSANTPQGKMGRIKD